MICGAIHGDKSAIANKTVSEVRLIRVAQEVRTAARRVDRAQQGSQPTAPEVTFPPEFDYSVLVDNTDRSRTVPKASDGRLGAHGYFCTGG
jgi:hypothetical protein